MSLHQRGFRTPTLRAILIRALLIATVIPLTIFAVFNNLFLSNHFNALELEIAQSKCEKVKGMLTKQVDILGSLAPEYFMLHSRSDDMFVDIAGNYPRVSDCPTSPAHTTDIMLLIDENNNIVSRTGLNVPEAFNLLKALENTKYTTDESSARGLVKIDSKILAVAYYSSPSSDKESSHERLILGTKLDTQVFRFIKSETGFTPVFNFDSEMVYDSKNEDLISQHLADIRSSSQQTVRLDDSLVISSTSIFTPFSNTNVVLSLLGSSPVISSSQSIAKRNTLAGLSLTILLILFIAIHLNSSIAQPLRSLEKQITLMDYEGALAGVYVSGPYEIVSLANSFNQMVKSVKGHRRKAEHLEQLSIVDDLTSLPNHRSFHQHTKNLIGKKDENMHILLCDIDYFRIVNNIYGHSIGDRVLVDIANILENSIGSSGECFRYGGEEFALVLTGRTDEEILKFAEQIRTTVKNSDLLKEAEQYHRISISIGIARYIDNGDDVDTLVDKANRALYYAKSLGRNRCQIYNQQVDHYVREQSKGSVREELLQNAALAIASAIDAKDQYTGKHSESVKNYALMLADEIKMPDDVKKTLRIGALLHDCGKIGIPDDIICKNGKLTEEEWQVIKNHTTYGYNIVKHLSEHLGINDCVLYHHERWDGNGYPEGLSGTSIPLLARIVAIADAYHAMVSDRPYRNALTTEEALNEITEGAGMQFDPELAVCFVRAMKRQK